MLRFLLLLALVALIGIGAFVTRPSEAAMAKSADALLQKPGSISEGLESLAAAVSSDRAYEDYYVVARYTVMLRDKPLIDCWGAYTQIRCERKAVEDANAG
jgi:hypothetical protein